MRYSIEIYDSDGVSLEGELRDKIDVRIDKDLNGIYKLTFKTTINDENSSYIDEDDIIIVRYLDSYQRTTVSAVSLGDLQITVSDQSFVSDVDPGVVNSTSSGSNTSTTLNDTTQSLSPQVYRGGLLEITSGTGSGQKRTVYDNTATQIELSSGESWDTTPDSTSAYTLMKRKFVHIIGGTDQFVARVTNVSGSVLTLNRMPSTPESGDVVTTAEFETFRVVKKTVSRGTDGVPLLEIECEHISYDLNDEWVIDVGGSSRIDYSSGVSLSTVASTILSGSTWTVGWNEISDSDERPVTLDKDSIRSALKKVKDAWDCDIVYNEDKTIDFLLDLNSRSGYIFRFGSTETGIRRTSDSSKRKNANFAWGSSQNWRNVGTRIFSKIKSISGNEVVISNQLMTPSFRNGDIAEILHGDLIEGTITGYNSSTGAITDSSLSLTSNEYVGGTIYFISGTNEGVMRRISSNSTNSITPYQKLDSDPSITPDTFIIAKKSISGISITDIDNTANKLTFSWKGQSGNLPIEVTETAYIVQLVSLVGDLSIGKHPFYRSKINTDKQSISSTAESGSTTIKIYDSTQNFNFLSSTFYVGARVSVGSSVAYVSSHDINNLYLSSPLASDPTGQAYVLEQRKKLRLATDESDKFKVGDCVFVGLTDQRSGEIGYIVGIAGMTMTLQDELGSAPGEGDCVELRTASASWLDEPRRGKFYDSSQTDPYQLREQAYRNVLENLNPIVTYDDIDLLDLYNLDRDSFKFESIKLGDTITVQDEFLSIDAVDVRVTKISMTIGDIDSVSLSLSNVPVRASNAIASLSEKLDRVESVSLDRTHTFPVCVNWDDQSQACLLRNKDKTTNDGLVCLDPSSSMMDGRRRRLRSPLTKEDCPSYAPEKPDTVRAKKTASDGTVSSVDNDSWDLSHLISMDVDFVVTLDSHAFVIDVKNETTGSQVESSLAEAQILTVFTCRFDAASGTIAASSSVSWDGGGSTGSVFKVNYYNSSDGTITVYVFSGSAPGDNDVITDGTNTAIIDGTPTETVRPYNQTTGKGCYIQVRRASGTDSLKVTAAAVAIGFQS